MTFPEAGSALDVGVALEADGTVEGVVVARVILEGPLVLLAVVVVAVVDDTVPTTSGGAPGAVAVAFSLLGVVVLEDDSSGRFKNSCGTNRGK